MSFQDWKTKRKKEREETAARKQANKRLLHGIKKQNLGEVKVALSAGADPNNIHSAFGDKKPLELCIKYGTAEIMQALLDAGGDPNLPIYVTKKDSRLSVVVPLIEHAIWEGNEQQAIVIAKHSDIDLSKTGHTEFRWAGRDESFDHVTAYAFAKRARMIELCKVIEGRVKIRKEKSHDNSETTKGTLTKFRM